MIKTTRHIALCLFFLLSVTGSAQLVISPGSSITITQGTLFFIGTNLYIKSDGSGSGHLADQNLSGNTTITGDITIDRYLSADGWHNTSSPVNNSTSSIFTGTDLIFYYDETIILNDWNFGWVWYDGPLSVMRGYDIFLPSTITTSYYSSSSGNLNSGTYSLDITRTDPANGEVENRKGWNLLGNPFPSPLDWLKETGWNKNDINDAKYIWNPDNSNYTIFLGGTAPTGINGATQYIPSNQGFWVQAMNNGSVQVDNTARVGVASSTPGFYKNSDQELRLIASGNNYNDEALIRFIPVSSINFDLNMDASKLFTRNDSVPQLYTKTSGQLLAINTLPSIKDNLPVLLEFRVATAGIYMISISDHSTVTDFNTVYLLDKLEDKMINLSSSLEYRFHHNPSNENSRFVIYFNPSEDLIKSHGHTDDFSITTYKNTISIIRNSSEYGQGRLNIYNLHGQNVYSNSIENTPTTKINLPLSGGYYIASIIVNNSKFNYKILISQ